MVETFSDTLREVLSQGLTATTSFARNFTRSLYRIDERGAPDLIGSCVLVSWNEMDLLITARHVLDLLDSQLLVSSKTRLIPVNGIFGSTGRIGCERESDSFDFGLVSLDQATALEIGKANFLPSNMILMTDVKIKGAKYALYGFPLSRNKIKKYRIPQAYYPICVSRATDMNGIPKKWLGSSHIILDYDRDQLIDSEGNPIQKGIHPRGLSGSGIWKIGEFSSIESVLNPTFDKRLVAIATDYPEKQGIIVGVNIWLILQAIQRKLDNK